MRFFRFFRSAGLWLGALALTGCATAPAPWDDPIDVTQLLRLSPESFRMVSVIPRGLGETGEALFDWTILSADGAVAFHEAFELQRVGALRSTDAGQQEATYRLQSADRARFQTQQIRQRAQLLSGFYNIDLYAAPALCDHAGIPAGSDVVFSVLLDTGAKAKITTLRLSDTAAGLERSLPFCL